VADPLGSGFVASLSRPGGNLTGFTNIQPSMAGKSVELLKEVAPRCVRVRMLFNRTTAPYAQDFIAPFEAATRSLSMESIVEPLHHASEIEPALRSLGEGPDAGLVVLPDVFTTAHRVEIISLAAQLRLPAVYPFRYFAELGGLLSYGNDTLDMVRRTATYADRILKGAKPGELPMQAPVKFELLINMRTAKGLGLDVPSQVQQRADQVIE
jgi:putative ABC transport system substrate-binding protein